VSLYFIEYFGTNTSETGQLSCGDDFPICKCQLVKRLTFHLLGNVLPVRHRSAAFGRRSHYSLSSVYRQLRGNRRRVSGHRLMPATQWLQSTAYQLQSPCVSMDRHRHSYNGREVRSVSLNIQFEWRHDKSTLMWTLTWSRGCTR
jgi:hypothetical protein